MLCESDAAGGGVVGGVRVYHRSVLFFFFQAEDGIRDLVRSRGLGDVYKRQVAHVIFSPVDPYQSVPEALPSALIPPVQ